MTLERLTPAEREVWERIQRDVWIQMKLLFPRLEAFDGIEVIQPRLRPKPRPPRQLFR